MIMQQAYIVGTGGKWAWVEAAPPASCSGCAAGTGCGVASLGRFFSRRQKPVRVYNRAGARLRDKVSVGIPESALLTGSFAVYMVPLILMFVFALAAGAVTEGRPDGEAITAVAGIAGLAAGFAWLKLFAQTLRNDHRFQPVVIETITS